MKAIIGTTVEVIKRSELHTFAVLLKRWVVERSFAWLEKCRRLWKNQHQPTYCRSCFHFSTLEKILNMLLANFRDGK